MDFEEYRKRGKEMVDYIADYLQDIRSRRVFPDVSPGYMTKLVPSSAPEHGEKWEDVFKDIERVIMPGITHWQSPHMHAYFPALNSFPSLLGDMLADAIGCLGFTWASSPACTELETIVMDWLGKMIELPTDFLHSNEQTMGGGVIQTTASDATFVCLLAARSEAIRKFNDEGWDPAEINARLVGYCSDQAHSSVEKAGLIGLVKMRLLPSDDNLSLRGDILQEAIDRDRDEGLIPFFLCATLGTTGACAFDNLKEVGPICEAEGLWMHIDAAYAGTAFVCPEYRKYMEGVDYAQSFAFNPSKWMMVHFDCTAMWVKNSGALHRTFNVEPLYLKHENSGAAIDYMHWQVPLSKRFRALKLWFVLRMFGVEGIRKHVRHGVRLAKKFEMMVRSDERFEVPAERVLGMVVFCLRDDNDNTEALLKRLNKSGKLHMVPAALKEKYVIRFTVTSQYTTDDDLERDWVVIRETATRVLADEDEVPEVKKEILQTAAPEKQRQVIMRVPSIKRKDFGMSLILSNVPMSPKFINGSFAAIFDNNNIIVEFAKELSRGDFNGKTIMLSPRRRMKLRDQTKQQSLDCNLFAIRRSPGRFKQGSLDSKIDEILETSSYDSDTQSGLLRSDSVEENGFDAELKLGSAEKGPAEGDSESLNGVHMICKHCGKPVED
ncbi:histidine decarboxylase-like isoform X1 [Haliotis rufescens]|uniref:histidine decarboxylase-like isoform X1 n=1 Tax=Haliotis rufescens TaxID=6454 RepID=UPI001EB05695|nr:histidine decarboxylase-like isoform X1 [Haliotis rufescens]